MNEVLPMIAIIGAFSPILWLVWFIISRKERRLARESEERLDAINDEHLDNLAKGEFK